MLVGPLTEDGYVDYVEGLNQRYSLGVTPDTNAAVLLFQAHGPFDEDDLPENAWVRCADRLGVAPLPEDGQYFVLDSEWEIPAERKDREQQREDFDAAMTRPWSEQEFPVIARWLKRNEQPLDLVVAASHRPRFFMPLIERDRDDLSGGGVMTAWNPGIQRCRRFSLALQIRSLLRIRQGDLQAAWQDLMVYRRLARLCAKGATLQASLKGFSIETSADSAQHRLLQTVPLSLKQLRAFRADLDRLEPLTGIVEKIHLHERFQFLSAATSMTRPDADGNLGKDAKALRRFDWDSILRRGNLWFDRIVKAARVQEWDRCSKSLKVLGKILQQQPNEVSDELVVDELLQLRLPDKVLSRNITNRLLLLMMPSVLQCVMAEHRANVRGELTRISFALAAYKRQNGRYPEQLSELCPDELEVIPPDRFSGKEPIYRRTETGYQLYSVGANGKDDEGRSFEAKPRGDDVTLSITR